MIRPLLLLLLLTGGSSAFANEEAPNTFNGIVQDDITFYHGCGAGCHSRHFQLTDPLLIEGTWARVKVMSATYIWDSKKLGFVPGGIRGAGNKEPDNASIYWIFADCKGKKVAYGQTPNLSEMSDPKDVYYGSDMGKFSGKPQQASVNHSPYDKWAPLCLENQSPGEEMGHENKKVLLAYYKEVMKGNPQELQEELERKAMTLVMQKYDKRLRKRLEGTGVNPSYMADYEDECNVAVKAGTSQPRTWSVMERFEVDLCKGEAKRWTWSRKEGKVYDDDF